MRGENVIVIGPSASLEFTEVHFSFPKTKQSVSETGLNLKFALCLQPGGRTEKFHLLKGDRIVTWRLNSSCFTC